MAGLIDKAGFEDFSKYGSYSSITRTPNVELKKLLHFLELAAAKFNVNLAFVQILTVLTD